jgi:RNA polymerase sigma factor (TIGR02999 family)
MSEVTQILESLQQGDRTAADRLLPLVYDELRKLAAAKMAQEKPGQTLQATALVHEAWIRLAGSDHQAWRGRSHFYGAAAEAMRRILIDKARRKAAQRHGGGLEAAELHESRIELKVPAEEFIAVHDAVEALALEDGLAAQVVKLRYFVGMETDEIADALEISPRSVDRHWAYARAWLKGALNPKS